MERNRAAPFGQRLRRDFRRDSRAGFTPFPSSLNGALRLLVSIIAVGAQAVRIMPQDLTTVKPPRAPSPIARLGSLAVVQGKQVGYVDLLNHSIKRYT